MVDGKRQKLAAISSPNDSMMQRHLTNDIIDDAIGGFGRLKVRGFVINQYRGLCYQASTRLVRNRRACVACALFVSACVA